MRAEKSGPAKGIRVVNHQITRFCYFPGRECDLFRVCHKNLVAECMKPCCKGIRTAAGRANRVNNSNTHSNQRINFFCIVDMKYFRIFLHITISIDGQSALPRPGGRQDARDPTRLSKVEHN